MIPLWSFTIILVLLISTIIWQIFRIRKLDNKLDSAMVIIGYYSVRFGDVTWDDIAKAKGIPKDF